MQRPGRRERKRAKWCSSNLNLRAPTDSLGLSNRGLNCDQFPPGVHEADRDRLDRSVELPSENGPRECVTRLRVRNLAERLRRGKIRVSVDQNMNGATVSRLYVEPGTPGRHEIDFATFNHARDFGGSGAEPVGVRVRGASVGIGLVEPAPDDRACDCADDDDGCSDGDESRALRQRDADPLGRDSVLHRTCCA